MGKAITNVLGFLIAAALIVGLPWAALQLLKFLLSIV